MTTGQTGTQKADAKADPKPDAKATPAPTQVAPQNDPKHTQSGVAPRAPRVASVGRVLHAYSPAWVGPRPAIVVGNETPLPLTKKSVQHVNVNVLMDGSRDVRPLAYVRTAKTGNTFTGCVVHEPMTEAQRLEAMREYVKHPGRWCEAWNGTDTPPVHVEWPPRH